MKPEYWDRAKRALARRDPVLAGIMRRHPRVHLVARGEPFARVILVAREIENRGCGVEGRLDHTLGFFERELRGARSRSRQPHVPACRSRV